MAYTTVDLISAELNGLTINTSTTPSSSTVEGWIAEADAQIDLVTGRVWSSSVMSSAIFDSNGTHYFKFPEAPIIAVSTVEYDDKGLGADSESWTSLTEGRTNDFILYVQDGEIQWITVPPKGYKNLRITYTKGYATTPVYIQRLSTIMVTKRIIETAINDSANEGGGSVSVGNISITDPSTFAVSHIRELASEIKEIYGSIGDTYVFRPSRVYEMR